MKSISKKICAVAIMLVSFHGAVAMAETTAGGNESVGSYVDASVVTATVKSKIMADKLLNGSDISVTTEKDIVMLSGTVLNDAQKTEAEKVAKLVDGVKSVDNKLAVK